MKEHKNSWDRNAGRYDRFMRKDRAAYEKIYALLRPVVKAKTVLELATGTGLIAKSIVNAAAHIEATDASAEMIVEAKRDNRSAKLHFSVQDMFRLPYAEESFDVVIVSNALHIVPQPEKALAEIRRVLKDDGVMIAPTFTHAGNSFSGKVKAFFMKLAGFPLHSRWTSEEYLRFLRQNGWTVRKSAVLKASFPLTYEQLAAIAPTVMIDDDISYVNWRGRFQQLGQWFDKEAAVEKWLADYDAKATELAARIRDMIGDETFAVLEANSVHFGSYYIYRSGGPGELVYDELKLTPSAGVPENVWGEVVDAEYFSLIDADHIFFFSDDGRAGDTGNLAVWKNMKAVKAGKVYFGINEDQYNMAFTAMGKELYLEKLANAILNHGDVE